VGYPVENKTILLLDDDGKEVTPGQVGEIVVKSEYLAPGYWRNPEQTEAVFRSGESPKGARLYFTGDLGRMDHDGCLTCLGRKNARVKIRGYGVDLIEVEIAITKLDPVKEAVVMAHQNSAGYAYLVAYIVPVTLPGPTNHALRQALSETLPDYMIPTTFVILGALPQTTSGKIDRQTLPAPGRPYRDLSRPLTLPKNQAETTIANIWGEVLGHETIDVHDHFYDLGGESLQALRIMAKIRRTFCVNVDIQSLIDAPTVAEMALQVTKLMEAGTEAHPLATPNTIWSDSDESHPIGSRLRRTSAIFFALWPALSL
jgi:acyl carrier protein